MKRLIDKYLVEWKSSAIRKPLLLRGARQVGKTYAVRELGKTFQDFVEINFESNEKAKIIFEKDLDAKRILEEVSILIGKQIIPGKTLLFLDEVQAYPQSITSLRYFSETFPELHVIAAGSLIDFAIQEVGVPVGRVSFMYMYPMSFIEFLLATEQNLIVDKILSNDHQTPLNDAIHSKILSLLGQYLAIGGMPEVVNCWHTEKSFLDCMVIQNRLIDGYKFDFNKYAKKHQVKYLNLLLSHIPSRMGKKFKFSEVSTDYKKRELSPSLDLLETAGIIKKVFWSAGNGIPLGAQTDPEDFKVIFLDIALAQVALGLNLGDWIIDPLTQFINKGEFVEAFVGQEILAYSKPYQRASLYYWHRQARSSEAEVDYLIQDNQNIIPIEVKSGTGRTLKSMQIFLDSHKESPYGIRFSTQNYSEFEKVHSYPLYAIAKIFLKDGLK